MDTVYVFHTDSTLLTAVRDVFGWNVHAPFTSMEPGEVGQTLTLAFNGGHRLNVRAEALSGEVLALNWDTDGEGAKPDEASAARIGHALETFLIGAGFLVQPADQTVQ